MPLVSVIVPVYKVEKVLHYCLDSILSQTFQDFELLLIDDGSPDDSGKICDKYADKDKRIRVIHKKKRRCFYGTKYRYRSSNRKVYLFY